MARRKYVRVKIEVELLIAPTARTNTKKLFTDIRGAVGPHVEPLRRILDYSFDEQGRVVKVTPIPFTRSDERFIAECADEAV